MNEFYLLDWDTHFFGYNIASVRASDFDLKRIKNLIRGA